MAGSINGQSPMLFSICFPIDVGGKKDSAILCRIILSSVAGSINGQSPMLFSICFPIDVRGKKDPAISDKKILNRMVD